MREIKFRGKTAGGWNIGIPFKTNHNHHTPDLWYLISDFYDGKGYGSNSWDLVNPETIGQFTGLKDKNGKDIYEGDILRIPPKREWDKINYVAYEIFFHDNDYCESSIGFQMNRSHFQGSICGTMEYYKFIPSNTKKFEIIGNIHDNPELL